MKLILFFLLMISFSIVHAQDVTISVSAGNNNITASPYEKNDDKKIIISKSQKGFLNIKTENDNKEWKRDFYIVDDAGGDIIAPVMMKENEYCSKIIDLFKSLQVSKDYYLYTQSLPKDPKQAMLVKVPRKLICVIRLEN